MNDDSREKKNYKELKPKLQVVHRKAWKIKCKHAEKMNDTQTL